MTDAADNFQDTQYGPYIDFAAPGYHIYSTSTGGGYAVGSGCSYAAPLVAGVVAWMFGLNPTLSPDEVIGILKDTLKISDERAAFEYEVRSGSFVKFDKGLIDEEQKIADILYDGHAIKKKVKVDVEYDPQFNAAQNAVWPIKAKD